MKPREWVEQVEAGWESVCDNPRASYTGDSESTLPSEVTLLSDHKALCLRSLGYRFISISCLFFGTTEVEDSTWLTICNVRGVNMGLQGALGPGR